MENRVHERRVLRGQRQAALELSKTRPGRCAPPPAPGASGTSANRARLQLASNVAAPAGLSVMPSRRQQRRSLAIAWLTMIVAASLAHARDDIADLFEDARARPSHDHVSNRRTSVPSDKRTLQKSLSSLPGPDIFEDAENVADTESSASHRRFKRIADPMDSPQRRVRRTPRPRLAGRRRSARRMFRRFAVEESSPADESEAEYESLYDDDVDFPAAFLNDELTKKRNQFEDVYPEVGQPQQSPPDFLKRPVDAEVRKKRNREEEEEADCADGAHEEYYYEDEAPEVSRRGDNKRASHSAVEYVNGERRIDRRNSNSISAVNANHRTAERDKNSRANVKERAAPRTANIRYPLKPEKIVRSSVKGKNLVKRKSQKKPTKEKERPKPKSKPKPKPKSKSKPKKFKPLKKQNTTASAQSAKFSDDCCEEEVEGENDADRYKRERTLVIKAVPRGKNVNELQIYQKAADTKKKTSSKVAGKHSSAKKLTAPSMGEVKDLLGKLMLKIDHLHDLVSELRNGGGYAHIEGANEKSRGSNLQTSNRPASCRRRWGPWSRWGACSVTCGRGAQSRSRSCIDGCRHVSLESEERVCSHPECAPPSKFLGIF